MRSGSPERDLVCLPRRRLGEGAIAFTEHPLLPLLARSILTTIRESDPPLHVAVRVRKSRWNLVGHPRVLQAVDVAGIVQPEEQHADAVAIVVNNAWAVRHGVADIVRGREVAAQAEAHHRQRTVFILDAVDLGEQLVPAREGAPGRWPVHDGQVAGGHQLHAARVRAHPGRTRSPGRRCRSPPSLSPTSPTTETRAMCHSRTWPCQLELVVHQAGSGAPWLAR